ncbi:MAG: SDR family oxidoreductase [Actinobacteria bacterium]|nr:SDR family oxidoreductase [Actinomycetota bacterium]
MTTINNKHVLITGGASGIGRLLVLRCAEMGAAVTILDVDEAGARAAAAEAADRGPGPVRAFACDVGDREQVAARAAEVLAAQGPVDILVNNAGVVSGKPLLELSDEHIERTFRVNTLALYWTTKAFLPAMVARGSGHIVTVASAAGLIGSPRETDYAASKFAAVGFNEALRMELKRSAPGVKTTVVRPFYVDTGMFAGVKTRFPLLLPILKEGAVTERILRAIQHDTPQIDMPWMVRTLPLMRMLPVWALDGLADFFGITVAMDEFTGRETPAS